MRKACVGGAITALVSLTVATQAPARATVHHCGNPPGWSGRLTAINVGCRKARGVFKRVRCSDRQCSEIHSGAWACYRRRVTAYSARGNCHLGRKRIRWLVFE
jgi:hypothetical protein